MARAEVCPKCMRSSNSTPLWWHITTKHKGNVTHAAAALGVNRSTLHRVIETAYVIDGELYTIKRGAL